VSKSTTKKAIVSAFKELLLEKPLNKITINDIAEKAEINRQTFYYHFQDIVDLVEWICQTDGDAVLKDNRTYDTWQTGYLSIFEIILKDKPFIMNLYRYTPRESLYNYLYRMTYQLMLNVVNELCEKEHMTVRDEDKAFVANFFKFGFVGLVVEWIDHGMQEDPEQIVAHVESTVQGSMSHALRNIACNK